MFENPKDKYCMRGDPNQTQVEWHLFKTRGRVCYIHPIKLTSIWVDDKGKYTETSSESDLIPVPWTRPWQCPEDVPDNCWIRYKNSKGIVGLVIGLSFETLNISEYGHVRYGHLVDNYEWANSHKAEVWYPCTHTVT